MINDQPLWLEVKVTHAVEKEKAAYLRAKNIAGIEVDLSGVGRFVSKAELRDIIVHDPKTKKWLHHQRREKVRVELTQQLNTKIAGINQKIRKNRHRPVAPTRHPYIYKKTAPVPALRQSRPRMAGKRTLYCEHCRHLFSVELENPIPTFVICPACQRSASTNPA